MTELTSKQKVPRCQYCGIAMSSHPPQCYPIARPAFDQSQIALSEQDRLVGELLAAIVSLRPIETIQNSHYASEYFALLDHRRQM